MCSCRFCRFCGEMTLGFIEERNRLAAYTEEQSAFLQGTENVGRHEDHDTCRSESFGLRLHESQEARAVQEAGGN